MIVGINGFGRIGKQVYRILVKNKVQVSLVNDPNLNLKYFHYLAKFDSVYGSIEDLQMTSKSIMLNGIETFLSGQSDPQDIEWSKYGVDYVMECSGKFNHEKCLRHNAQRVIVSCPIGNTPTIVYGVNHHDIGDEKIISCASCTTNCIAPLAKILNDNFGIVEGSFTTVHSITASQKTVDVNGLNWRSSRSCLNIIPTETGAHRSLEEVIPSLGGKIYGMAFRVPVIDVSVLDFVVKLAKPARLSEIRRLIEEPSDSSLKNVMSITYDEVVSGDIIGDSRSSVLDYNASKQINKTLFKLVSWYDNEYSYACRMVDMLIFLAKKDYTKNEIDLEK